MTPRKRAPAHLTQPRPAAARALTAPSAGSTAAAAAPEVGEKAPLGLLWPGAGFRMNLGASAWRAALPPPPPTWRRVPYEPGRLGPAGGAAAAAAPEAGGGDEAAAAAQVHAVAT